MSKKFYSTSSASMELSLGAPPPLMAFIMVELACTLTFCCATSCKRARFSISRFPDYKVMILPSSEAGAGRSEGGESAGELREGNGVGRTQPRPKRDAQLLQEDVKHAILFKIS